MSDQPINPLPSKKVSRLTLWGRRFPFGIKRRPCQVIDGVFVFGAQACGRLTFRRQPIKAMNHHAVDCGKHDLTRWGGGGF